MAEPEHRHGRARDAKEAILFHDMVNVSEFSFPNYRSHYDPAVTEALIAIMAVIVTFFWGSKTLARYRYTGRP